MFFFLHNTVCVTMNRYLFIKKLVFVSPQYNAPYDEAIKGFYNSCILYFQTFNNKCSYNHCFKQLSKIDKQ